MRTALAIGAIFLLLAFVPAAIAKGVGGGSRAVYVPGQDAAAPSEVEQIGGDYATIDASASIEDVVVKAQEPTCDLRSGTDAARSSCTGGGVSATNPVWNVDYDLDLPAVESSAGETGAGDGTFSAASIGVAEATPVGQQIAIAATAAGVSLAALYGLWRALKLAGLTAFIPLYSHIQDDELLSEGNRARIFELIRAEPGISTRDVATRLDLAWGTVTHHLWKLEKRHVVVSKKYGKYRRYFANGAAESEKRDAVAVLKVARTADVENYIRSHPGVNQKEVGAGMGVSASTILWHVKRLEQVGLVSKVRDGKNVRYFAIEKAMPATFGATPVHAATPAMQH